MRPEAASQTKGLLKDFRSVAAPTLAGQNAKANMSASFAQLFVQSMPERHTTYDHALRFCQEKGLGDSTIHVASTFSAIFEFLDVFSKGRRSVQSERERKTLSCHIGVRRPHYVLVADFYWPQLQHGLFLTVFVILFSTAPTAPSVIERLL